MVSLSVSPWYICTSSNLHLYLHTLSVSLSVSLSFSEYSRNWNPTPPPLYKLGVEFSKFPPKMGFQIFLIKREGLVKRRSVKKGVSHLVSSLPTHSHVLKLCVCFVHLHHFYQSSLCFPERTYTYSVYSEDVWVPKV